MCRKAGAHWGGGVKQQVLILPVILLGFEGRHPTNAFSSSLADAGGGAQGISSTNLSLVEKYLCAF